MWSSFYEERFSNEFYYVPYDLDVCVCFYDVFIKNVDLSKKIN